MLRTGAERIQKHIYWICSGGLNPPPQLQAILRPFHSNTKRLYSVESDGWILNTETCVYWGRGMRVIHFWRGVAGLCSQKRDANINPNLLGISKPTAQPRSTLLPCVQQQAAVRQHFNSGDTSAPALEHLAFVTAAVLVRSVRVCSVH